MTRREIALVDITTDDHHPVWGEVIRDFPHAKLSRVELSWSQSRKLLASVFRKRGVVVEHDHWNWKRKMATAKAGHHRIVAVHSGADIQGLMVVLDYPRTSRLQAGVELLYVDYIETAPWNIHPLPNHRRLAYVGTALFGEAIQMSIDLGFGGRVGLHSLPQVESFYAKKLSMTDCGPDVNNLGLCYFEIEPREASQWLLRKNC